MNPTNKPAMTEYKIVFFVSTNNFLIKETIKKYINRKLKTPINLNWKIIFEAASGSFSKGAMKNCFKDATAPEITAVS
jgi:hypothetical protein